MMKDHDAESRLRRYAQAFRREAKPLKDPATLLAAARRGTARPEGRFAMVPAVAMAAGVLLIGVVIAIGAWQLRALSHKAPIPPISLMTPAATPESTATPNPSPTASAGPSPTPSGAPSGVVPGLAAIQMVGPRLGWAGGWHAIYSTSDGTHWTREYTSSEEFFGVDFISSSTGWAVGVSRLLGTTDGGRSWHKLGEAPKPIRSVHFASANSGWGIAGGDAEPGQKWPGAAAIVITTDDGGRTWRTLQAPIDPQSVCFSDGTRGWLATGSGTVYSSQDSGRNWTRSLQMTSPLAGNGWARIQCAAPSALWVYWHPGGAAGGHSPYTVYATIDGQHWRTVMTERYTAGNEMPGVPDGPGSSSGSFSVVDPDDAVFVGDTPPAMAATCMIATNGGATLKTTGSIVGSGFTQDAAFVSTLVGWVITIDTNGDEAIVATTDGGYHWSQQLAVQHPTGG